jgi:hypothetical protein
MLGLAAPAFLHQNECILEGSSLITGISDHVYDAQMGKSGRFERIVNRITRPLRR